MTIRFDVEVAHRDVCGQTFCDWRAKLTDFGLAHITRSGGLREPAGTPGFMAPEQLQLGANSQPTIDVFGIGMVIKYLISRCDEDCRWLAALADRCTQTSPNDRPQSVAELSEQLEEN